MSSSLMDNAVLLSVSFRRFGVRKTVGSDEVETDADRKMIHVAKDLIESDRLDDIKTHHGKVAKTINGLTSGAAFLRAGVRLLGVDLVEEVNARLKDESAADAALVDLFMDQYPLARESAARRLGSLFNLADYPSAAKVRAAFGIEWNFLEFATPGKLRGVSPETWAAENAKLSAAFASAADEVTRALRGEASKLVEHLVERLSADDTGKRKKFHDTLTGNLHDFLETFQGRNITNDQELAALVEDARKLIGGVDASHLRDSDTLRVKVASGFSAIKDRLDGMLVAVPKRRINLADVAAVEVEGQGAAA